MESSSFSINNKLYNLHKKINDRVYCGKICHSYFTDSKFKPYTPLKNDDMCLEDFLKKRGLLKTQTNE